MQLKECPVFVNFLYYEATDSSFQNNEIEINPSFTIIDSGNIVTELSYCFELDHCRIRGELGQEWRMEQSKLEREEDVTCMFSEEERATLLAPLFDVLQRLIYDVTEISLDKPGVNLTFSPELKE